MPEIPDLSKLKEQAQQPQNQIAHRYAFRVMVGVDGNVAVTVEPPEGAAVEQVASLDDIYAACALIMRDISMQQTVGAVQHGLLQMGQAVAQQQATQAIRSNLKI